MDSFQVLSEKDQAQYWHHTDTPHNYVTADQLSKEFKESHIGKELEDEISKTCDKSKSHQKALSFNLYSLTKWELFKTCMAREYLLMKRDAFVYVFKTVQVGTFFLVYNFLLVNEVNW